MFVPGITYPKLQNISLKGAERMKKARAMAVFVILGGDFFVALFFNKKKGG